MSFGLGTGPLFEPSNLRRILIPGIILVALLAIATKSGAVERAWRALTGNRMPVEAPVAVPVSKPVLSEHQREWLETQASPPALPQREPGGTRYETL